MKALTDVFGAAAVDHVDRDERTEEHTVGREEEPHTQLAVLDTAAGGVMPSVRVFICVSGTPGRLGNFSCLCHKTRLSPEAKA
jgi:hypothetical protein